MNKKGTAEHIAAWMSRYSEDSCTNGFVVGISGGIDSALCSTLSAMTGKKTLCVTLPLHQASSHVSRATQHIDWLKARFPNVESLDIDLSSTYDHFKDVLPHSQNEARQGLTDANTRSRLRMVSLYYVAGLHNCLVVGTGNKVEDFGVGFFTKYGDGGVDLSPIADLTKTEVFALSEHLGICSCILSAPPTDGLFGDDRSDEDQIGAGYPELEWAMEQVALRKTETDFSGREREVMHIYLCRNRANRHKMEPIPVCTIPSHLK